MNNKRALLNGETSPNKKLKLMDTTSLKHLAIMHLPIMRDDFIFNASSPISMLCKEYGAQLVYVNRVPAMSQSSLLSLLPLDLIPNLFSFLDVYSLLNLSSASLNLFILSHSTNVENRYETLLILILLYLHTNHPIFLTV
jgi:hypothetical protein